MKTRVSVCGEIGQVSRARVVSGQAAKSLLEPRRRENLRLYLTLMRPGEIPACCWWDGIPATGAAPSPAFPLPAKRLLSGEALPSGERLACSGTVVGPGAGYLIPSDRPPVSEASASIIWEGIHRYFQDPPLLWNALPFHPHRPGNPRSNRLPALVAETLAFGLPYLMALLDLFPSVDTVLAVGERAGRYFAGWKRKTGCVKRFIVSAIHLTEENATFSSSCNV